MLLRLHGRRPTIVMPTSVCASWTARTSVESMISSGWKHSRHRVGRSTKDCASASPRVRLGRYHSCRNRRASARPRHRQAAHAANCRTQPAQSNKPAVSAGDGRQRTGCTDVYEVRLLACLWLLLPQQTYSAVRNRSISRNKSAASGPRQIR